MRISKMVLFRSGDYIFFMYDIYIYEIYRDICIYDITMVYRSLCCLGGILYIYVIYDLCLYVIYDKYDIKMVCMISMLFMRYINYICYMIYVYMLYMIYIIYI